MKTNLPATTIFSSSEIQIHYKRPLYSEMKLICSAESAEKIIREFADPNRIDLKEFFWVMTLTNANRLLGISEIASGSSSGVIVSIKEILQLALLTSAVSLIIFHVHPSGNLNISAGDKRITSKLKKAAELMEITLLDHIIISSEGFVSFAQEGLL